MLVWGQTAELEDGGEFVMAALIKSMDSSDVL